MNTGLVHILPGTTFSNTIKRRENDSDRIEKAKIRLSELEGLLVFFICEVANSRKSRGLGLLRGLGDVPLRVWNEKAGKHFSGPLPPEELFIALCGEWEERTIQRDGITWDYITYESPDLITLINNPKHRNGREHGQGTMYKVVRDPADLGQIFVVDPYQADGRILVIPACAAHRKYATGRHRYNHRCAVAAAQSMVKGAVDFDRLMQAMDMLGEAAVAARKSPGRKRIHHQLSRFLHGERVGRIASEIRLGLTTEQSSSTASHLDPLAIAQGTQRTLVPPSSMPAPARSTATAKASPAPRQKPMKPAPEVDEAEDDLAALRALKQWRSSDA